MKMICNMLETPWTVACQASLSMGFSREEHWSGVPFPSPGDLPPGDLPHPEIKLASLESPSLTGGFLTIELSEKPCVYLYIAVNFKFAPHELCFRNCD